MRTRRIIGLTLGGVACLCMYWVLGRPERIQVYGTHLRVGGPLPDYDGTSKNGIEVSPTEPAGSFHIHFAGLEIPDCLDLECTSEAANVLARQGHVHVLDVKVSEDWGVPRLHDGVRYLHADTLMIVSDQSGKILAMYRGASLADLDLALDAVERKSSSIADRLQHLRTKMQLALAQSGKLLSSRRAAGSP